MQHVESFFLYFQMIFVSVLEEVCVWYGRLNLVTALSPGDESSPRTPVQRPTTMYYPTAGGGSSLRRNKSIKRRQSSSNPTSPAEMNEVLMTMDIAKWFRDDHPEIEEIPLEVLIDHSFYFNLV